MRCSKIENWKILIDIMFMVIIVILSIHHFFFRKKRVQDSEDLEPKSILILYRFLGLGAVNSYFVGFIFELDWVYWITLYSAIGILFCFKTKKKIATRTIAISVFIIIFALGQVPSNSNSFEKYVNQKEMYQCVNSWECVRITSNVTPDGTLKTEAKIVHISDYSFDWYLFFAKGSMKFENEDGQIDELKGINLAGFWFEY
jgi:hypothetical protein